MFLKFRVEISKTYRFKVKEQIEAEKLPELSSQKVQPVTIRMGSLLHLIIRIRSRKLLITRR